MLKKGLLFFLLFVLCCLTTSAQGVEWLNLVGDRATSIVCDQVGNTYTMGTFRHNFDFNTEPDSVTMNTDLKSIFIVKFNSTGNLVWAKQFQNLDPTAGSLTLPRPYDLELDNRGHLYITGTFKNIFDFDPGPDSLILNSSEYRGFIVKLDTAGNFHWVKTLGGSGRSECKTLALDSSNNLIISGLFYYTIDFNPGIDTENITSTQLPNSTQFVLKLDSAGNFKWVKTFDSNLSTIGFPDFLDIDKFDNIVIAGNYSDTIDIDPGPGIQLAYSSSVNINTFLLKLDPLGNTLWAKSIGYFDANNPIGAMSVNPDGDIFLTGEFFDSLDIDPGPGVYTLHNDVAMGLDGLFLAKFNAAGNLQWAKNFGNKGKSNAIGIDIDFAGNILISGEYKDTFDIDPDSSNRILITAANNDFYGYVVKLSAIGKLVWHREFYTNFRFAGMGICSDTSGNAFFLGECTDAKYTIGPDTIYANTNDLGTDVAIAKIIDCPPTPNDTLPLDTIYIDSTVCFGASVLGYDTSDIYSDTVYNICGIRFIQILDLTVIAKIYTTVDTAICFGMSYYVYDTSGNYIDTFTSYSGCDSIRVLNLTVLSTSDQACIDGISILGEERNFAHLHPNPTTQNFTINLEQVQQNVTVSITDLTGRMIREEEYHNSEYLQTHIDGPAGMYFVRVSANGQQQVLKVIKE